MNHLVNFKMEVRGKMEHFFSLMVECNADSLGKYFYVVEALRYGISAPLSIGDIFETPQKAFEYVRKVLKNYPRYNDERDYNIEYAPVFDIDLFKEPRPSSATN